MNHSSWSRCTHITYACYWWRLPGQFTYYFYLSCPCQNSTNATELLSISRYFLRIKIFSEASRFTFQSNCCGWWWHLLKWWAPMRMNPMSYYVLEVNGLGYKQKCQKLHSSFRRESGVNRSLFCVNMWRLSEKSIFYEISGREQFQIFAHFFCVRWRFNHLTRVWI